MSRTAVVAARLGVDDDTAEAIANRHVGRCEAVVVNLQAAWEAAPIGSCCKHDDHEYHMPCEHLRRLWDARSYLELARVDAPTTGAFPCDCHGSGTFHGRGYVENGVFKGTTGQCFRCGGKGWQSEADRKRNETYDRYYRRVSL